MFDIVKLIAFASVGVPVEINLSVAPPPVNSTNDVPDIVKLVGVEVFQAKPLETDVITILPVPKLIVLVLVLALVNVKQVNVYEPNANVPFVSVATPVSVNASCSVHVPPTPSKVNVVKDLPLVVIV